MYSQNETSGRN